MKSLLFKQVAVNNYRYHCEFRSETAMDGFKMVRLSLDVEIKKPLKWGAYMGSFFDVIFR